MVNKNYYVSSNEKYKKSLEQLSQAYEAGGQNSNFVSTAVTLTNTDTSIDVRPHFHRFNYERYRPGESIPKTASNIMLRSRDAYENVGIIRSVVDLMTEIAVEGLDLVSTDASIQNFYRNWAKKVNLVERAERFANYYLVEGNVAVRRKVGEITTNEVRRLKRKEAMSNDDTSEIEPGIVPLEYLFYDPSTLELIGGDLAVFSGIKQYGIRIDSEAIQRLLRISQKERQRLLANVPKEIVDALNSKGVASGVGAGFIVTIPTNRLYIDHYKKKDTDIWAKSFIYSILPDVIYNEKLRLAKISALDGWHNATRLWKLGDHEKEILPDTGAFAKLASILQHHPGGMLDIIWDSMISMETFYPPIEKLENFTENFEAIMLGLGVPQTLVGGSEAGGVTNMFIGLRNMMKRIDGVRRAISMWIDHEVAFIGRNLGFREQPKISYSLSNLFDQQSYFKLLVDLYDRQMISDESVLKKIGEHVDIERKRTKEEYDLRQTDVLAPKMGQFMQPTIPQDNKEFELQKLALERKEQDKVRKSQEKNNQPEKPSKPRGRPPGTKDTVTRNRRFRSKAELIVLGDNIQRKIDTVLDKAYLGYNKVSNKRQLTHAQRQELSKAKMEILACVDHLDFDLNMLDTILQTQSNKLKINEFLQLYNEAIENLDKDTTSHQLNVIKSYIFAEINYV